MVIIVFLPSKVLSVCWPTSPSAALALLLLTTVFTPYGQEKFGSQTVASDQPARHLQQVIYKT